MNEPFVSRYTVTIGDINYGGHLGNERALLIFQDARIRLLKEYGFSEKDIGGAGIIMVESGVRYLREVFLHDELAVAITAAESKRKKFTLEYEVARHPGGEIVLRGSTSFLAYDYERRTVTSLPPAFAGIMGGYRRED